MYKTEKKLILASASPRRKSMLENLGIRFSICSAEIDEEPRPGEMPENLVVRLATEKVQSVAQRYPESWVLGADTIVCINDEILGKPTDQDEAVEMLMRLSGTTHDVFTGYSLLHRVYAIERSGYRRSGVSFGAFDLATAQAYVATGEPLDKAGAYGIQGLGSGLVREITGSYTSIVGIPLDSVISLLTEYGVISSVIAG
ncbi:MAG: septum formation protein Maf [Desulfobulbaceae bacterium]|nr:MAG: septum formation protein Maf [Desulfobulbaceae bacterium]